MSRWEGPRTFLGPGFGVSGFSAWDLRFNMQDIWRSFGESVELAVSLESMADFLSFMVTLGTGLLMNYHVLFSLLKTVEPLKEGQYRVQRRGLSA